MTKQTTLRGPMRHTRGNQAGEHFAKLRARSMAGLRYPQRLASSCHSFMIDQENARIDQRLALMIPDDLLPHRQIVHLIGLQRCAQNRPELNLAVLQRDHQVKLWRALWPPLENVALNPRKNVSTERI